MYRVAVLFFAIIGTSFAQELFDGTCPLVKAIQPFSAAKFSGSWYEWVRFSSATEKGTKCNVANYWLKDGIANITYSSTSADGKPVSLVGSATYSESIGQLNISIPQISNNTLDYVILGTDYDNWSSLFVCKDRGNNKHQRYLWIVTKSRKPSDEHILAAKKAATDKKISTDRLQPVDQQSC